jgi:hypothetical protein
MIRTFTMGLILCLCNLLAASELFYKKDATGRITITDQPGYDFIKLSSSKSPASAATARTGSGLRHESLTIPMDYLSKIRDLAQRYDIREDLIIAVAKAESSFNPHAVSRKGAVGLMQLMADTARKYGVNNRYNAYDNLDAGIQHLKHLYDKFNNIAITLAAYNAGEDAVQKYGGIPPFNETRTYIRRVMSLMGLTPVFPTTLTTAAAIPIYRYTNDQGHTVISDTLPSGFKGSVEVLH